MSIFCPNCGTELPDGVSFCDACGTPLRGVAPSSSPGPLPGTVQIGSSACPVCAAPALPGEAFCDNCGAPLLAPAEYAGPAQHSASTAQGFPPPPAATRAASLVVTSPPPPATLPLAARPEMIVGRSDPQSNSYPDVDLGPYGGLDLGVSRRHFRLARTGDQTYVEDLGSMNGTVVNGQKLPPYSLHPLKPGDRIVLGKMELRFELA